MSNLDDGHLRVKLWYMQLPEHGMQVGLCYQLAFNGEKFSVVVEARTLINHTIGEWQRHHKITHSTSVQPLYNFTGAS